MEDVNWYANCVATVAALLSGWSLGWQIKSNWWDRPNIVLEDCRVSTESEITAEGQKVDLGWVAQVTVSNTGNAETTLRSLEWEFDYGPDDRRSSIFVAGTVLGDEIGAITITSEDVSPDERKLTIEADAGEVFRPIILGRNHGGEPRAYRIGPYAVRGHLDETIRARPVASFVDRKDRTRRFHPKRHGVVRQNGPWVLTPLPGRQGLPQAIGIIEN